MINNSALGLIGGGGIGPLKINIKKNQIRFNKLNNLSALTGGQ
jgi:hypothetical protein